MIRKASIQIRRLGVVLLPLTLFACNPPSGGGPTPTPSSPPGPKRVFVSSQTVNGDLETLFSAPSGIAGADMACQTWAEDAGLDGNWLAWMSDNTLSALDRLQAAGANGPWHLGPTTTGATVFSNRASTTTSPQVAIDVDENGDAVASGLVWTGTMVGGDAAVNNCLSWTDDTTDTANLVAHDVYGRSGSLLKTDPDWTDALDSFCLDELHLYCLEI